MEHIKSETPNMLSIIIVSWNTAQLLTDCLASIFANPPASPFDVWVVDNASTDDSPKMLREKFPRVNLIENHENVGFARANNQAIQQCTDNHILLLNPDTLIVSGALQSLLDFLNKTRKRADDQNQFIGLSCQPSIVFAKILNLPVIEI